MYYKNPMYSAFGIFNYYVKCCWNVCTFKCNIFILVQIIVYAGAIMTLILFILMFLNIKEEDLPKEPNKYKLIAIGAVIMIPLNVLVLKAVSKFHIKRFINR
ncbi:MAG: NADH-quinone oxidoreductase subunit J [Arcobacter sp.]|nr:NADH-quinone oxidoreductase subunit J [Arcobacter sp.]